MKKASYALPVVALIIILDQTTKQLVLSLISPFNSVEILPMLHIVNVMNTGAAFGVLRNVDSMFFILISVAAIIFVTYLLIKNIYNILGLSLILAGAVGNLIDRILYGKVVDFIDFSIGNFHWYTFNIADSSLTIGIIIILLTSLMKKKK